MILLIWGLTLALAFVGGLETQRFFTRRRVDELAEVARVNQVKANQTHGQW